MESVTDDNVKRASAWRVKYMKMDNMQILPSFLGFHPRNRDGLGPNAERCEQLFLELLGQFDKVEANHDAVCVEKKPGCDSFLQFNRKACSGERGLADVGDELPYATLGHSRLNQCLKNVALGAKALSSKTARVTNTSGQLDLKTVASIDSDLADACADGLRWQVLSWKMEEEEPVAVVVIQSVLNRKSLVQTHEREMQMISRVSSIVHAISEGNLAARVSMQAVR